MVVDFNEGDLLRWLDSRTLEKGRHCLRAVSDLHQQDDHLRAKVQGTAKRPYLIDIDLRASTRTARSHLHGSCSCPMAYNCKHVAAVLMAALDAAQETLPPGIPLEQVPPRKMVLAALSQWQAASETRAAQASGPGSSAIIFSITVDEHAPAIMVQNAQRDADGRIKPGFPLEVTAQLLLAPPPRIGAIDLAILGQLWVLQEQGADSPVLDIDLLLDMLIRSGNGWTCDAAGRLQVPVCRGAPRPATLAWQHSEANGPQPAPVLQVAGGGSGIVLGGSAWYVDEHSGEIGPLQLDVAADNAALFLELPPLLPSEQPLVARMLEQIDPALPRPAEQQLPTLDIQAMTPVLRLHSEEVHAPWLGHRDSTLWTDYAMVAFEYDEHVRFLGDPSVFVHDADGQLHVLPRDLAEEARRTAELEVARLQQDGYPQLPMDGDLPHFKPRSHDWGRFLLEDAPRLQALGWKIEASDDFRHRVTLVDDIELDIQADPEGGDWFNLALDIQVNDHTVALAPLLEQLLQRDPRWLRGQLDAIDDEEAVVLSTSDSERLAFRAKRLKPVIALLADLFAEPGKPLRVSSRDRGRFSALQDTARLQFRSAGDTRALVQRLLQAPAMAPVAAPKGLQAELRGYQQEGLAWLQYLRQQQLGGILADDMGLGKTLQTLAHVLLEKEAGRLDQPALVVVPTSLLHNWQTEAARFTPALRVLTLHGAQRETRFADIAHHDLVLTTYPLLWRDEQALRAQDYHLLILDEAQQVKNPRSRAATTLRRLQARHRLCLTGTPLENHLGELWTQFDFLLPGLLGDQKQFNQHWRHPIERGLDRQRADLLAQRVRPFMLRRRKDQVATELPAKTLITHTVTLEGGQRDLYETVRVAMEKKVREAITSDGLGRSHIVVLDALLKLRQVCCDPRLLPGERPGRNAGSAKLEMLRDLLPPMVEEGRRILLFSQFTGMLELIGQALDELALPYVTLTGQTRDRATPIRRFSEGEVPLFLISLKAGGVGLNLTAADTVIHFDPWWNPAAENQATDRAHRIGQQRPVFVYKLIAAGSIEERIAEMQQRKAALAESILEDGKASTARFSEEDLQALLAPLPGTAPKRRAR